MQKQHTLSRLLCTTARLGGGAGRGNCITGDGFAAFDITYTGRDNKLAHPFQTSWGVTTRLIGAVIMTHGDDNGLVLPPAVAPVQVVIVPIAQHKEGVLDKANELYNTLKSAGTRVK